MSDQVGNQNVGFLMTRLIFALICWFLVNKKSTLKLQVNMYFLFYLSFYYIYFFYVNYLFVCVCGGGGGGGGRAPVILLATFDYLHTENQQLMQIW